MAQNRSTEFNDKNNVIAETIDTMCLTFKVVIPHKHSPLLDSLYDKSLKTVNKMLEDRSKTSTKYWKEVPSVVAKSLSRKYQRNKKLKKVSNLVIPICGEKGQKVKIEGAGIRVPVLFKKDVIPAVFPKPIVGFIRNIELFRRDKIWCMRVSYNTPVQKTAISGAIGVDRNSVGNVAAVAVDDENVMFLGPSAAGIASNFRNRRRKLQKKGAKAALKRIKRKQSRRIKDINHKVSKQIVDCAKTHCSAIVLEDLSGIAKKGSKAKRYVNKSQWPFYQLQAFIEYKAALLGIPVHYINPRNTSKECSRCGSINTASGKKYICRECGHVAHRDANAALNIRSRWVEQTASSNAVGLIGNPLNQRADEAVQLESSGGVR